MIVVLWVVVFAGQQAGQLRQFALAVGFPEEPVDARFLGAHLEARPAVAADDQDRLPLLLEGDDEVEQDHG